MMNEKKCKCSSVMVRKSDSEKQTLLKCEICNVLYGSAAAGNSSAFSDDELCKNKGNCWRLYKIITSLTVEPVMFAFMFGYVMNMSVLSNMMMDKGCYYYFNYSTDVCTNYSSHKLEKTNVERLATDYSLYSSLLSFIAAFLMIFIAPWSDKYGRKLPLLVAVLGALLTDIGYIFCTLNFESRLEYLILSRLPSELCGGFICILMIMFSLASELSSTENRFLKYTSLEVAFGLGLSFGGLTGGTLYRYYGYLYVYVTTAALHAFGSIWILFVVEETRGLDKDATWQEKAKDFFVCESFKDSLEVTCKRRPGSLRSLLLCLMGSMCLIVLNYESFGTIAYVYVHHVFDWDPSIYSIVSTVASLSGFFSTILLVPIFIRIFKINDFILGIMGILSMMAKNLFIGFSGQSKGLYYAGLGVGLLGSLSTLSIRAGISKLVDKDELGRVFSFLATSEAIIPMLGTLIVTKIFEATMDTYPNVTYTMTVVILFGPLLTFIWAYKCTKRSFNMQSGSENDHMREKV